MRNSGKKPTGSTRQPSHAVRQFLTARFRTVPFIRHLGMRLDSLKHGEVAISLAAGDTLKQYQGLVHGGAIASLCDTAATFAVLTQLPEDRDIVTIEFKVNFLAPLAKGRVTAHARTVRLGSRVAVAEVEVTQGGRREPAAIGLFTMLVFPTG